MSYEVVNTSVTRGLRGESGFATAILTRGLPAGLETGLQEISGYDHDAMRAVGVDSIEWAYRIVRVRGRDYTVISRIAPNGVDASRRPNRIAHHLVLDPQHRAVAGPAWMLREFDRFETDTPEIGERANPPSLPSGELAPRPARAWQEAGIDPGWAGVIAESMLDPLQQPVYVVFPHAIDSLKLMIDVFALIQPGWRWGAGCTFSTRPLVSLPHVQCHVRLVRADAPGLGRILSERGVRVLRVDQGAPVFSSAAAAARAGKALPVRAQPEGYRSHPAEHSFGRAGSADTIARDAESPVADSSAPRLDTATEETQALELMPEGMPPVEARSRQSSVTRSPHRSGYEHASSAWTPLAIVLVLYSALACLGAVVLFILAFDRG